MFGIRWKHIRSAGIFVNPHSMQQKVRMYSFMPIRDPTVGLYKWQISDKPHYILHNQEKNDIFTISFCPYNNSPQYLIDSSLLKKILSSYEIEYAKSLFDLYKNKLGLKNNLETDQDLIQELLNIMKIESICPSSLIG